MAGQKKDTAVMPGIYGLAFPPDQKIPFPNFFRVFEVRICLQPNFPIIILIPLKGFHDVQRSRELNSSEEKKEKEKEKKKRRRRTRWRRRKIVVDWTL